MDKLQKILQERPNFHQGETEISRAFDPSESLLPSNVTSKLVANQPVCYGIGQDVLEFIAAAVQAGEKTLETGAGCSTLVFALRGARHIAVTPSGSEIKRISEYAVQEGVPLDQVQFAQESSHEFLPRCQVEGLDLVLLDGKHAFPWPMVDWFFTADRLRKGGLMIIDDAGMRSVAILAEFMRGDPGWDLVRDFGGKTLVFRKTRDSALDVAWHMQPFNIRPTDSSGSRPSLFRRAIWRLKRMIKGK